MCDSNKESAISEVSESRKYQVVVDHVSLDLIYNVAVG